jgi:1-aminocyclopropane-1-carboxylate deaminase/D-cysteine desulfhydrase-like pyridoxal-dependent ACC family enzyme
MSGAHAAAHRPALEIPRDRFPLAQLPTPVSEAARFRSAVGLACQLLIKRDDLLGFGFGGNKVRKMEYYAAAAVAADADTLISTGGVQSNHARVVAATAARLGMDAVLVTNGTPQAIPTANALLAQLFGAEHIYVEGRSDRERTMAGTVERLHSRGRAPFTIPLGASTPLGALGFVRAVDELVQQGVVPDVIVHSASSGGTCAGLAAGCALLDLPTRVVGISADEPESVLRRTIDDILAGLEIMLNQPGLALNAAGRCTLDASFVGAGYGIPTPAATEALRLMARTEAILLDPTYTAKAMAGLMDYARRSRIHAGETALFWHTGGQVGLFK